jgi:hypothetical protein
VNSLYVRNLVVGQFDVEAALRRHVAIPQTRDRRYSIKLTHYPQVWNVAESAALGRITQGGFFII